jgi:GntR family transcriptional regulator
MANTKGLTAQRSAPRGRHKKSADSKEPRAEAALHRFLTRRMRDLSAIPGRTKRSAARLALVAAIREGHLTPGAILPSEKALTTILKVSLGTVQSALLQLQQAGTIIRRRGDGTRVASAEPLSDSIWHFRFIAKETGSPLRLARQAVEIDRTDESGPWSTFFDRCPSFVRIRRLMTMSDASVIYAEMYLDENAAAGLVDIDPEELDMVSIRPFLEEAFGLYTASARHSVQTTTFRRNTAGALGLCAGKPYFEIHARALSADRKPVYFQRIFARCSFYILDF